MEDIKKSLYVVSMGALFAILQVNYFFELEIWLTAAYPSFLTIMLGWILGNVAGLRVSSRWDAVVASPIWLPFSILASLTAYYASIAMLKAHPYQMEYLTFYAIMIILSGAQAGYFFSVSRSIFDSASTLFFMENNGFVFGWIIGFFGFIKYGSWFIVLAPGLMGLLSVLLYRLVCRASDRSIKLDT